MLALLLWAALLVPAPRDWVPMRWPWTEAESLKRIDGTPVNCLLLESWTPEFAAAAARRGLVLMAVARPETGAGEAARRASAAGLHGVVLEGGFPPDAASLVRKAAPDLAVVELSARIRMPLGGDAPVVGTWQGVWPGVQVLAGGVAKAAPTGSPWIETNSGFLRAARAVTEAAIWIGNLPPANTVIKGDRYLQAMADAALAGGRWILALDPDFAGRLGGGEAAALRDWQRIASLAAFFESHKEFRALRPAGRLAVVQSAEAGALLSGGILDMIGARHTPVRAIPPSRLAPEALAGAAIAINVEPDALTPAQREVLRGFARGGGTVLTPAPGPPVRPGERMTLTPAELDRLGDIFRDVQSLIGRRNLGVRLFNVASMLSYLGAAPGGQIYLHLVNYSGYPVENVAVHLLGKFKRARLIAPEGERDLETYALDEGTGVDISKVSVWATLRLD
ncbi:MAG: hypothetical protein ACE15B_01270 [Bryobacteraceae bacterium]